jgi:hypothetical protein
VLSSELEWRDISLEIFLRDDCLFIFVSFLNPSHLSSPSLPPSLPPSQPLHVLIISPCPPRLLDKNRNRDDDDDEMRLPKSILPLIKPLPVHNHSTHSSASASGSGSFSSSSFSSSSGSQSLAQPHHPWESTKIGLREDSEGESEGQIRNL